MSERSTRYVAFGKYGLPSTLIHPMWSKCRCEITMSVAAADQEPADVHPEEVVVGDVRAVRRELGVVVGRQARRSAKVKRPSMIGHSSRCPILITRPPGGGEPRVTENAN